MCILCFLIPDIETMLKRLEQRKLGLLRPQAFKDQVVSHVSSSFERVEFPNGFKKYSESIISLHVDGVGGQL